MALEKFNRKPKRVKGSKQVVEGIDQAVPEDRLVPDESDEQTNNLDPTTQKPSRQESRRQQKLLLRQRKQNRPHAELVDGIHPQWEVLRQKDTDPETRKAKITNILTLIKGNERELAKKADGSRILQTIIQYGSPDERLSIGKALFGSATVANDYYAQHVLKKLVKESPECREIFVKSLRGNVEYFLSKRTACAVLDDLYNRVNTSTKNRMVRELYLKEYAKLDAPEESPGILALLEKFPSKREVVQDNLRRLVPRLLYKELLMYQVVQRLILDYFLVETTVKLASNETLAPFLADGHLEVLISGPLGCQVVSKIIAAASAKDRKAIIKILKPHFPIMIISSVQSFVIASLLSSVDDTVLLSKALLPDIIAAAFPEDSSSPLALDQARVALRSLLLIISGRVNKYVTPQVVTFLKDQIDPILTLTSKKDREVRQKELRESALDLLLPIVKEKIDVLVGLEPYQTVLVEYCTYSLSTQDLLKRIPVENIGFWKLLIKQTESLASVALDLFLPNLNKLVLTDSGFIFVVMLRYPSLQQRLRSHLPQLETIDSPAARLLVTKLTAPPSLSHLIVEH